MKPIDLWPKNKKIKFVFTDIDDTLTEKGLILKESFLALWKLYEQGIKVIPVTGRPAGWCEMIARTWPVDGIIGENGAFYFRYTGKMNRFFVQSQEERKKNRKKLTEIRKQILKEVPEAGIASDQFCRTNDLAIDFCEDVTPLPMKSVNKIVKIFNQYGAKAKISSIHVNGWFGDYDKLNLCETYLKNVHGIELESYQEHIVFFGDSPNDEPLFKAFKNSVGVANIKNFLDQLSFQPQYITKQPFGKGFAEGVNIILS